MLQSRKDIKNGKTELLNNFIPDDIFLKTFFLQHGNPYYIIRKLIGILRRGGEVTETIYNRILYVKKIITLLWIETHKYKIFSPTFQQTDRTFIDQIWSS